MSPALGAAAFGSQKQEFHQFAAGTYGPRGGRRSRFGWRTRRICLSLRLSQGGLAAGAKESRLAGLSRLS